MCICTYINSFAYSKNKSYYLKRKHKNIEKNRTNITAAINFFFLSLLSFTNTDDSQGSRGREETIFYFILPLPPAHKHSDIYLQLCMWDDYHVFLIAALVFTRLLLDEIYYLIELPFDGLIDGAIFVCLVDDIELPFDWLIDRAIFV